MAIRFEAIQGFNASAMPIAEIYKKISTENSDKVYEIFALKAADYAKLYRTPLIFLVVFSMSALCAFFYLQSKWVVYASVALIAYNLARLVFIRASQSKLFVYNLELRKYLGRVLEHKNTVNDCEAFV
jgi:hypothetical protein